MGIRGSQYSGYHFGGPNNKDYSILGVYIGVPLFGETTIFRRDCERYDLTMKNPSAMSE